MSEASSPPPGPAGTPFDFGLQAFTEFWSQAGKAALQAQEAATRAFGEAVKAAPGVAPFMVPGTVPGLPGQGGSIPAADTTAMVQAGQAMAELWKGAAGMSGTLAQALAQAQGAAGGAEEGTGGSSGAGVAATFRAMTDPQSWLAGLGGLDSVVGRVTEGPQLADLWQSERLQARVVQAWLETRQRGLEHNAVVLEAWMGAAKAFSEELAGRTKATGRPPDGKALLALWTATANRVLLETQRSEPFLRTQAAMIRAGTELRMAQRAVAERWADAFGLPSRTEMDDAHRPLTELRREVRRLRREVAGVAAGGEVADRPRQVNGRARLRGKLAAMVATVVKE